VFGEIYHASGVNRELRNKVLREWGEQGGVDMSWLYGEQPELPHVDNVPMPEPTRLASYPNIEHSSGRTQRMAKLDDALEELVTANRILASQGIVDSYGHVTIRSPDNPER